MNKILGFEKLSLVDYDGYVACTIFTGSCNFRCPFCHNSSLVLEHNDMQSLDKDKILKYLEGRKRMIDAVCISGGEPTLYKDLNSLIKEIKKLGFLVKLDTNGTNYEALKYLIDNKMLDYVAMDVKNCIRRYNETIGVLNASNNLMENVLKCIKLLQENVVDYEFRTTLVKEFHSLEDIYELKELLKGSKKLFLQHFVDRGTCIKQGLHEISLEEAEKFKEILKEDIENVNLRGY